MCALIRYLASAAILVAALFPLPSTASDACAALEREAAVLLGVPAGKLSRIATGPPNTVCEVRSKDRKSSATLYLQKAAGAGGQLEMNRAIAVQSADPGQKLADEKALGRGAFSLTESDKINVYFIAGGQLATVLVVRDKGLRPADAERARAFARQLREAR